MTVRIVPASPDHVGPVADRMRPADRDEVWAAAMVAPRRALDLSLAASALAWAATLDGEPICLFGVCPRSLVEGVGEPWLLGTPALERVPRTFGRTSRRYVARMARAFPVMANWVDARNAASIRWLGWLGFAIGPAQPFGPLGLPFHPFELR